MAAADAAEKRRARRAAARLARGDTSSWRHGARNENRASVVVKWLLQEFGLDKLRREGVVDIGGGRGELAARLAHCHEIPCILVEERDVDLQDTLRRRVAPKLPRRYREKLLAEGGSDRLEKHVRVIRDRWPLRDTTPPGILVGLHADGATESIVDVALRERRSFAVVPCCVFRQLFNPSGEDAYVEFCEHLENKDETISRTVLDFSGRNVCLHRKHVDCRSDLEKAQANNNLPVLVPHHWFPPELSHLVKHDAPNFDEIDIPNWPSYLKDWHVRKTYPQYKSSPPGLEVDWLGSYLDDEDDFDFCYVGPAGSFTDWHADVLSTFSWSANLCGTKVWWFEDGSVAIQDPRDVVFVPSDVRHKVLNRTPTVSVNRNFFNRHNATRVVDHLEFERCRVWTECIEPNLDDFRARNASPEEIAWTLEHLLRVQARLNFSELLAIANLHLAELPRDFPLSPFFEHPLFLHNTKFPTDDHPASWASTAQARAALDELAASLDVQDTHQ